MSIIAAVLLFVSGLSALVYQIIWVKQLSLVVGVDVHAVTIAVSGFFAGLALGGWALGEIVEQVRRPLLLYAVIEAGVGLTAVGCTLILACSAVFFAALENHIGFLAWSLPFLLVGLPAMLMGGTLPVLIRALSAQNGRISSTGGGLYAANTAGAIAGAVLTSFVLIPWLGVTGSALFAGVLNFGLAIGAFFLGRRSLVMVVPATSESADSAPVRIPLALLLYSIAGGIALGYEVVWSQVIVQWTSTRTFAFAMVLAVYLTGLMIGSALAALRSDRIRDPWGIFGFLIAAAGMSALFQVLWLGDWLASWQTQAAAQAFQLTGSESVAMSARFLVAATCIVLFPTMLLGAAFPVALRLMGHAAHAGRDAGIILAVNTLGGIGGTMLTGFVLIPFLGLEWSLQVLALMAGTVGLLAVLCGQRVSHAARWLTALCVLLILGATVVIEPGSFSQQLASRRKGTLLFAASGAGGTVAVIEQGAGQNRFRRLYIQGVSNSGDTMTSLRYMRLQSLLPLIMHRGEPRSALVIGLGTGITTGSLLAYQGLEKRVCAELMPEVVQAAALFQGNQNVTQDPRVDIRVVDGRRELLQSEEQYDLITLEPPPPSAAGVVNLYSTDFYALAAKRLNREGCLAQWLPLPTQTDRDTKSLVRSFLDVFPHVTLWSTELHEMLLVGSLSPMELDVKRIASRFQQPGVSTSLQAVGIESPAALLATFICDRQELEKYAGDVLPVTDDRPGIEYGDWVLPGDFERTLSALLAISSEPVLIHADAEFQAELTQRRSTLHAFYESALAAYAGDRQRWKQLLTQVSQAEPENPYYRWFSGNRSPPNP